MRTFDGKFLEFPLSCLSYPTDKMESILAYCIMKEARKIKSLHTNDLKGINEEYFPQDFDENEKWCLLITIASFSLRIKIKSYERIKKLGVIINIYINDYTEKYGDDAYCRVGKSLFIDTMHKRFNYKHFAVLCAISSVIGKGSEYKRITKDKISYRMLGYKSKEIFCLEHKPDAGLLTRRQLERIIDTLHGRNFFGKFTYARRVSYYSTKLDDEQLRKRVFQNKLIKEKQKMNDYDNEFSALIKNQIALLKKQHKLKMCTKGADYGSLN